MFKAPYFKADGKKGRARALPESLFDGVVNEDAMHEAVRVYRANQRQGTAAAKTRAQVRGGNRKPWRQKGTGRARHGSIRSPIWTGGGRAFPPVPGSWNVRIPRKVKALARRSALNARAEDDRVILVDRLEFDAPKTRRLVQYLEQVGAEGKVLLLLDGHRPNVHLSARNEQRIQVRPLGEESVYDILWANQVVIERDALEAMEAADGDEAARPAAKTKAAPAEPAEEDPGAAVEEDEAPEAAAEEDPEAAAEEDEAPEAAAEEDPEAAVEEDEAPEAAAEEDPEAAAEEGEDDEEVKDA